jgi:hypothetical protein
VRQSTKARDYPRFPAAVCEQRVASTVTTPFGRVSCDKPAGSNVKVVTNRISKGNGVAALMGLRKVCVPINQSTKETLTESQLGVLGPLNPRVGHAETLTHTTTTSRLHAGNVITETSLAKCRLHRGSADNQLRWFKEVMHSRRQCDGNFVNRDACAEIFKKVDTTCNADSAATTYAGDQRVTSTCQNAWRTSSSSNPQGSPPAPGGPHNHTRSRFKTPFGKPHKLQQRRTFHGPQQRGHHRARSEQQGEQR